ncbi:MAG TPA: hypothetical protein VGD14_09560 [bacterium]
MNEFIPVAVQRAGELADTLHAQLSGTKPEDTPKPEPKDTLPPNNVADTPPEQSPAETDTSDYKAKYLTIQGKYNAEVPKLTMEIRSLKALVNSLEDQNLKLTSKDQSSGGDVLNKEKFEQYGEEFGSLVDEIQQLKKQNADLVTQINSIQSTSENYGVVSFDTYMKGVIDAVAKLGANFDSLNNDPVFIGWLKQVPVGEYESRIAKLRRAENSMDLPTTVEIFRTYLGQAHSIEQNIQDNVNQQAANPPNVQPPHNLTGSDINPKPAGNQKVWSRSEITKFYADQTAGAYRGRETEAATIENDIFLAQVEGRIRA